MKINFKFFNFSSIEIKKKSKYIKKDILYFNNHFKDFIRAQKGVKAFIRSINTIQKQKENNIINDCDNKKHWALKKRNEEVEPVLLVLMGYGYSRDYIINHIFDGYNGENYGTENEVKESFLNEAIIIKMTIDIDNGPNKERLIAMIKDNEFYPLFIDVNHSLYHSNPTKVISKLKMEFLVKDFLLKKIFFCL